MFCINLESGNPFFNLAVEEILLKGSKHEYFIIGTNSASVIVGKHQTAPREINMHFITRNQIPVIRRISGGGTVYHDEGNLNFTFIRNAEEGKQIDFRKYTKTTIDFLQALGIDARFEGKNDIRVGGLKVSGNAEHVHRNRVLHHGTLLVDTSLEMLRNSLRKDGSCYSSRGVESIRSSVTNLSGFLENFRNINDFRSEMMKFFMNNIPDSEIYTLSAAEISDAENLANSKYKSWEWNWAYGPEYEFTNSIQINRISVRCTLIVSEGIIRKCNFEGSPELDEIAQEMAGCRHMPEDLLKFFDRKNLSMEGEEIFKFF